jgi:hypothetical protein
MDWHFTQIDHDSRNLVNASELTVTSRSELSDLEIFVREVLQNSLDNRDAPRPASVDFRLKYLTGKEKDDFLQTLKFTEISDRIKAIREYDKNRSRGPEFPDPSAVTEKDYVLKLLYVEDHGTRGLIGPEHSFEVSRFPKPHCFIGLCRNNGDSQKSGSTAGGIYGLGKTVLWKHSPWKIVFFHSRMLTPYTTLHSNAERWTRFFGHVRLTGHHKGEVAFSGGGYWGTRRGQVTWSLMDEQAERSARDFGMSPRGKSDPGTSILIVDFQDPDSEDHSSEEETLRRIRDAAENYYWPALTEGLLTVRTRAERSGAEWQTRDILEIPQLAPFLRNYASARSSFSRPGIFTKEVPVHVPKGPGPGQEKTKSTVLVATSLVTELAEGAGRYRNRTALIRGSGMVVGYRNFPRIAPGGSDYFSIVLGGKSCPEELSTPEASERCEQFLAHCEPVSHDDWTLHSENLKKWYGSKAELRRMLDEIRKAIGEATVEVRQPEGKVTSLLSSLFPLASGAENESIRDMHVEFLQEPTIVPIRTDHLKYEFAVRVRVPAKFDFAGAAPSRWKVECRYGFHGEDVRRKVVQEIPVYFTEMKKGRSDWMPLPDPSSDFEGEVSESNLYYDFRGETAPLEKFAALTPKQELQIRILKSYES